MMKSNVKFCNTLLNWVESIENFIKVSTAQIILNRSKDLEEFIRKDKNSEEKKIINTRLLTDKFHLNLFLNDEELIEKINKAINILEAPDDDEYAGLKPNSVVSYSSSKLSTSSGNKKDNFNSQKIILINFFFKRRNVRFIVEKWNFIINYNDKVTDKTNLRRNFIYKKLMNLTRTLSTVLRILPMYNLTNLNLFEFDYEISNSESQNINKNSLYNSKSVSNQKFNKMEFTNYSDTIGSIKIHIYYMNKNTILLYEDEMKKNIFEDSTTSRHRFDSECHIPHKDSQISLKRANSKSVDNSVGFGLNIVQINDYISIEDKKVNKEADPETAFKSECNKSVITFTDFISKEKINEKIQENSNEIFLLKFKINNLQQFQTKDNEQIQEESKSLSESDSDFSLVSNSDNEILDITNEDFSDFELKELSIQESFEDMNKSIIETVSSNNEQDYHKFFITYTKIKNLMLKQKHIKFDLISLVKSKMIQKP